MKLRIQGNSLRLRLTQKEVALAGGGGRVESFIEFAPGCTLFYLLESSLSASSMSAAFDGCAIRVTVPAHQIKEWAESGLVGIEGQSPAGVQLLVEKDFKCLHRSVEQEPGAYPHPLMSPNS